MYKLKKNGNRMTSALYQDRICDYTHKQSTNLKARSIGVIK